MSDPLQRYMHDLCGDLEASIVCDNARLPPPTILDESESTMLLDWSTSSIDSDSSSTSRDSGGSQGGSCRWESMPIQKAEHKQDGAVKKPRRRQPPQEKLLRMFQKLKT